MRFNTILPFFWQSFISRQEKKTDLHVASSLKELLKQIQNQTSQTVNKFGSISTISIENQQILDSLSSRIGLLASSSLFEKTIPLDQFKELQTCQNELTNLKLGLQKGLGQNSISLENIQSLIDQLDIHNKIIHDYKEKRDQLMIFLIPSSKGTYKIKNLQTFLNKLQEFDHCWKRSIVQNSPTQQFMQDLHTSQMNGLMEEWETALNSLEKKLESQLKQLRFSIYQKKPTASTLASSLKKHLNISQSELNSTPSLSAPLQSQKQRLLNIVIHAKNSVADSVTLESGDLSYDSNEWHRLFSTLPFMPQGNEGIMAKIYNSNVPPSSNWQSSALKLAIGFLGGLFAGYKLWQNRKDMSAASTVTSLSTEISGLTETTVPTINGLGVMKELLSDECKNISFQISQGRKQLVDIRSKVNNLPSNLFIDAEKRLIRLNAQANESFTFSSLADWRKTIEEESNKISLAVQRHSLDQSNKPTPSAIQNGEQDQQLISKMVSQPLTPTSDRVFAHLLGLYRPEVDNTSITDQKLMGLAPGEALTYLIDHQKAYLTALKDYPNFSSSRRSNSREVLSKDSDFFLMTQLVEKMEFALVLIQSSPQDQSLIIEKRFSEMQKGDSFFFPIFWNAKPSGHAVVLEVEKDAADNMMLRLFNLGAGSHHHAHYPSPYGERALPYIEIVSIDPKRFFGGAMTNFLNALNTIQGESEILGNRAWDSTSIYHLALASLGGEVNSRMILSSQTRDLQWVGICSMNGLFLAQDKTLYSTALAERMRALILFRATKKYYDQHKDSLSSDKSRESRRRLLLIGTKATLEAIERALEVGGILEDGAKELLKEMKSIQKNVQSLHEQDLGILNHADLSFSGHQNWTIFEPTVYSELLHKVSELTQIPKKNTPWLSELLNSPIKPLEQPAGFGAYTFKDASIKATIGFAKHLESDAENRVAMLSPLELDGMFQLGFQDAKSLASIQCSKGLKITESLALFSQNLGDFLDSDRLNLLQSHIFHPQTLEKNLQDDPGLVPALAQFCRLGSRLGHLIQNAAVESTFASLSRTIQQTLEQMEKRLQIKIEKEDWPNSSNLFSQLIADADPISEKERLRTIHIYRVKSFEMHTELNPQEAAELLTSINYLKAWGLPGETSIDPKNEISRATPLTFLALRHMNSTETAKMLLNSIAKGLDPFHEECDWLFDPDYQQFRDPEYSLYYDPEALTLHKKTLGKQFPPLALSQDALFKKITGDEEKPLDKIQENVYIYRDQKNTDYRFILTGSALNPEIITQRKFKESWHQAFDPKHYPILPNSKEVFALQKDQVLWHENGIVWASISGEKTIYFTSACDQITLQLTPTEKSGMGILNFLYTKQLNAHLLKPTLESTGETLLDQTEPSLLSLISRIEDPKFTFSFAHQGNLARIQFPRFGLEFDVIDDHQLACKQVPGFTLSSKQLALPIFGDFIHYLPLTRNTIKGEKEYGVIIPNLSVIKQNTTGLMTPTKFEEKPAKWTEQIPYFFYRVHEGNRFTAEVSTHEEAVQAYLHLATIFLSERSYHQAAQLLDQAEALLKSMGKEIDDNISTALLRVSDFFAYTQDSSPDAAALRLRTAAIYQRLFNLDQTVGKPIQINLNPLILSDFAFYQRHINRVSDSLRLSSENRALLSKALEKAMLPKTSSYSFPTVETDTQIGHPPIAISSNNSYVPSNNERYFTEKTKPLTQNSLTTGQLIISDQPLFIEAFPDFIIPLYTLLREPKDIGLAQRQKIARAFGLDALKPAADLKLTLTTLIELRYRYLLNRISFRHQSEKTYEVLLKLNKLELECSLLGALIRVSRGEVSSIQDLEQDVTRFKELKATLNTLPEFTRELQEHYFNLINNLTDKTKKEALALWNLWIEPHALPIPLSIEKSKEAVHSLVGPFQTEPLLQLVDQGLEKVEFASSYHDLHAIRPALITYFLPLYSHRELDKAFAITDEPVTHSTSPFQLKSVLNPEHSFIADQFNKYDQEYQEYLAKVPDSRPHYTLKDKALLHDFLNRLKDTDAIIQSIETVEQSIVQILNKSPSHPLIGIHNEVRKARGVIRELTIDDAKAAFAKGWDIQHLHYLNPALSVKEIEEIFEMTMEAMLEKRELQKRQRAGNSIDLVINGDSNQPYWQVLVEKMRKTACEKLSYDPYEYPVLLLIETEYDIALWPEQVPVIAALTKKMSALIEFAMALGKSDVVSPAVLALLADGQTLPILVMPDALLATASVRLQQRMGQGLKRQIQTIPVERRDWPLEKINALKDEMTRMINQRVPLVWSSTDVNTLINSFFEERVKIGPLVGGDAQQRIEAWKNLFNLMRTSSIFFGDEIHSILDILTSYNFSLGDPEQLDKDEMDAVADFIKLIATHPEVVDKVSIPSAKIKGKQPLTEQYFHHTLKEKLIDSFLEQGITNDPDSKELFAALDPNKKAQIRSYLSNAEIKEKLDFEFFPALSHKVIDQLEDEKLNRESKEVEQLLSTILTKDRLELKLNKISTKQLATALRTLEGKYRYLDRKIRNYLAVQKESLRIVFLHTSSAQFGKHYVLNKEENEAIPAENGDPIWDSHHGTSLERLFYTAFLFSQKGIERELIHKDLKLFTQRFRQKVLDIADDLLLQGEVQPELFDDPLLKEFNEKYGTLYTLRQRDFTDLEVDQLTQWVNEKIERQLPFIRATYFTQQKVFPEEIESSTHFFPLISKPGEGMKGMGGTLFNRDTYPDVFAKTILSDTIPKVINRMQENSPIETITIPAFTTDDDLLSALYNRSSFGPGGVIETTGAYIKNDKVVEFAHQMLKQAHEINSEITACAFFDEKILKMVTLDRTNPILHNPNYPQDSIIGLWGVAFGSGANILVNRRSHSYLIIGKHTRLFEIAQNGMRKRDLGSGQRLILAVPEEDKQVMASKLSKYLNIQVPENQPLTRDQVFQYNLLNEILEETENNWRAIDMKMRVAVLEPILDLLWNKTTSAEKAIKIFNTAQMLVLKKRTSQPWEQYGNPNIKSDFRKAIQNLLEKWKAHPALQTIKNQPALFAPINIDQIVNRLTKIASGDHGPLQPLVELDNPLGHKKRTKDRGRAKTKMFVKDKIKNREQIKTRHTLFVKKKNQESVASHRQLREVRRSPYRPISSLPLPTDLFTSSSHRLLSADEAKALKFDPQNPDLLAKGAAISISDFLSFDPALSEAIKFDDPDLSISLNLAPVWVDEKDAYPLYTPYNLFHKFPSHALLLQEKGTERIQLRLVDAHEADLIAERLKQERASQIQTGDLHLSLYHLHENRMIASGKSQVNPEQTPMLNKRLSELIAQAKLLSGITHYSKEESAFLQEWIGQRDPAKILRTFILQIGLQHEKTLEKFPKSSLAKIFQNCGIEFDEISDLIKHPLITTVKPIYELLFDRGLTIDDWLRKANDLQAVVTDGSKNYAVLWSDALAPLLPVLFDLPTLNSAASRQSFELLKNDKALQRRWIMSRFFPSVADEYGAWKTAVPQLRGSLTEARTLFSSFKSLFSNSGTPDPMAYGSDADAQRLLDAFTNQPSTSMPTQVTLAQLEMASELTHPIWGLPLLSGSYKVGEFQSIADKTLAYPLSTHPSIDTQALAIPTEHRDLALKIANQAVGLIDIVNSLKAIEQIDPNYEFERLYGLFAFLAKQEMGPDARRQYALQLLPRLFMDKFGEDMRFFTQFIPEQLTVNTEAYSTQEITQLLDRCYKNGKSTSAWRHNLLDDSLPTSQELSYALRAFARNAPNSVAKVTADWMNALLRTSPQPSWWLDMMLFQMMMREDILIDHQQYALYFQQDSVLHMLNAHRYQVLPSLTLEELDILTEWKLSDFDLFTELAGWKTLNKPQLTPYQLAEKWAVALQKATHVHQPTKEFWHKILGGIAEKVRANPPQEEKDRNSLRQLLGVMDASSSSLSDSSFIDLQEELGAIRLAADHSFEQSKRNEDALAEIEKLSQSNPVRDRIYRYFIPNFLLPSSEAHAVTLSAIDTHLDNLSKLSKNSVKLTSPDQWRSLFELIDPFTLNGSSEQQEQLFKSINRLLGDSNTMITDILLLRALDTETNKIDHIQLKQYVDKNQQQYISEIMTSAYFSMKSPPYFKSERAFISDDFDLFAEATQLKTANRLPLFSSTLAQKIMGVCSKKAYNQDLVDGLPHILNLLYNRAVEEGEKVDKKAISNLITSIEKLHDASGIPIEDRLIQGINSLRMLSDFIASSVDLQTCIAELLTLDPKSLRARCYLDLIPQFLRNINDDLWVEPLASVLSSSTRPMEVTYTDILETVFKHRQNLHLFLNKMLASAHSPNQIINHFLAHSAVDFSEINFDDFNSYVNCLGSQKDSFIISIAKSILLGDAVKADKLTLASNNNLVLLFGLLETTLKGQPQLKVADLIRALDVYINKPLRSETTFYAMLDKIIQLQPFSDQEKESLSKFVRRVEEQILITEDKDLHLFSPLSTIRTLVEFSRSPEQNLGKMFRVMMDKTSTKDRRALYKEIAFQEIKGYRKTSQSLLHNMTHQLLDLLVESNDSESKTIIFEALNKIDEAETKQAAAQWLKSKVQVSDTVSKNMKAVLMHLTENGDILDYSLVEQIWKKLDKNDRIELIKKMGRQEIFEIKEILVNNDANFPYFVEHSSIQNKPELPLLQLIVNTQLIMNECLDNLQITGFMLDSIVNRLPSRTFLWWNKDLTSDEKKALLKLIDWLESKGLNKEHETQLTTMRSYL